MYTRPRDGCLKLTNKLEFRVCLKIKFDSFWTVDFSGLITYLFYIGLLQVDGEIEPFELVGHWVRYRDFLNGYF